MPEGREMPEYLCVKQVHALEIEEVIENHNGSMDLFFVESGFAPINIEHEFRGGKPTPQTGWFYVQYKGGYFSFSPRKEFLEGYQLMK